MSFTANVAAMVGITDAAFRLLISILLSYPIAVAYRKYVHGADKFKNNLFLAASGCLIVIFNYGFDVYHSLLAIVVTYLLTNLMQNSPLLMPVAFCFHMGYLLIGYYFTSTENYDICWTMPHCILCLRLIGLAVDVADGTRPDDELSADGKKLCLRRKPGLLEIAAFTYFPASVLVGPQFSFKRFNQYVEQEFDKYQGNIEYGLKRLGGGLCFLAVRQIVVLYINDDYLLSDGFASLAFYQKCFVWAVWGKSTFYKYYFCWMFSEGAASFFGLTFGGVDPKTNVADWSALSNIKVGVVENSSKFNHYVEGFNVQTNFWVAHYVYKRLKFLNNRHISQAVALTFLAIWHGFHSGYFLAFLIEFTVIRFDKEVEPMFKKNEKFQKLLQSSAAARALVWVLLKMYMTIFTGHCLTPFALLKFSKYWHVNKEMYFCGFIFFTVGNLFGRPLLKMVLPPNEKVKQVEENVASGSDVKKDK